MMKKIVFICGDKEDYPRNTQILNALSSNFEVIKIASCARSYLARIPEVLIRFAVISFFRPYEAVYAGFLAQPLVPIIRLLTRKPLLMDGFVSVYDVLCLDRKDFSPASCIGRISFWLDTFSCALADRIIADTRLNADFLSELFKIKREKFSILSPGIDESIFYPQELPRAADRFIVFFHGTFWPLHGIEYIIQAAKLLEKQGDIAIRLLGGGREKKKMLRLKYSLSARNVEFIEWVSYPGLAREIAKSDLCLGGHFSGHDKAQRVISGKTFMYLAMKKPVIVGDNPATREAFTHRENAYMCRMADASALAEAIVTLKENSALRGRIAQKGFELFQDAYCNKKTQVRLKAIIENI